MKRLTVPQTKKLMIGHAGTLSIRSWDKSEIEIRYRGELINDLLDDKLTISCESDLLISVPEISNIIVDKTEDNCKIFGRFDNLIINKVIGNLEIESLKIGQIGKVGGNCKIGDVENSLQIEKIEGNCYLNKGQGKIKIEKINGNFHGIVENIEIDCKVGGNIHLQIKDFSRTDNQIKAGGNIRLLITECNDISFIGTSGGSYHLEIGGDMIKGKSGKFNKNIGSGQKSVILSAGGSLKISDHEDITTGNMEFASQDEKGWSDLEKVADNHFSDLTSIDFPDMDGISKKFEKLNKFKDLKINKIVGNSGFDDNFPEGRDEGILNHDKDAEFEIRKKVQPVSEEEKMIILKMLQDKKITAEEADRLLNALEQ